MQWRYVQGQEVIMPSYKDQVENYKKFKKEEDASLEEQQSQQDKSVGRTILQSIAEPGYFTKMRNNEKAWSAAQDAAKSSKGMKKGGKVSSASSRADGIAQRGKTKGRMV